MVDKGFGVHFEHLVVSEFVVEGGGKVGLVGGLRDKGGNLRDVRGGDGAAVEAGEAEEEKSLLWGEVTALDEDSHNLPRVVPRTGGKDIVIFVLSDTLIELSTDISHRSVEKDFLRLGKVVLSGDRGRLLLRQLGQPNFRGKIFESFFIGAFCLSETAVQQGGGEVDDRGASRGELCQFLKQLLFCFGGSEVVVLEGRVDQSLCGVDGGQWLDVDDVGDVGAADELVVRRLLEWL